MKAGDWVVMKYGDSYDLYYILYASNGMIVWNSFKWLVSSARYSKESEFLSYNPIIVGNTKRRWWRKYTPFKDLICPFKIFHYE